MAKTISNQLNKLDQSRGVGDGPARFVPLRSPPGRAGDGLRCRRREKMRFQAELSECGETAGSGEVSAPGPARSPLVRRLEQFALLPAPARDALEALSERPSRSIAARRELVRQGSEPNAVLLVKQGWACRNKALPNGRRQIIDFLIPGDLCGLDLYILPRMDHSIGAITALEVVEIPLQDMQALIDAHPRIGRALWRQELVSKSCHREWIVNVGARSAVARVAHLLCELFLRLDSIGAASSAFCPFPLTQADLADATGLTPVHVNRTLQKLREKGLIQLGQRMLAIPDMAALMAAGQFKPDYLHLKRPDRRADAAT